MLPSLLQSTFEQNRRACAQKWHMTALLSRTRFLCCLVLRRPLWEKCKNQNMFSNFFGWAGGDTRSVNNLLSSCSLALDLHTFLASLSISSSLNSPTVSLSLLIRPSVHLGLQHRQWLHPLSCPSLLAACFVL